MGNSLVTADGMRVVPINTLMRYLIPRVAGLPYELAVDMLRVQYAEMARKSGSIRPRIRIPVQQGVANYPIVAPEGFALHSIHGVSFDRGRPVRLVDTWCRYGAYGYYLDYGNVLMLTSLPSTDNGYDVAVIAQLVPSIDATVMPEEMATLYGDAIAAGAAAEAMNTRGKPWYDPGNSVRLRRTFDRAVLDARSNEVRGHEGIVYMRAKRWV